MKLPLKSGICAHWSLALVVLSAPVSIFVVSFILLESMEMAESRVLRLLKYDPNQIDGMFQPIPVSMCVLGAVVGGMIGLSWGFLRARRKSGFWAVLFLTLSAMVGGMVFVEPARADGSDSAFSALGIFVENVYERMASSRRYWPRAEHGSGDVDTARDVALKCVPIDREQAIRQARAVVDDLCNHRGQQYADAFAPVVVKYYGVRDTTRSHVLNNVTNWVAAFPEVHECMAEDFRVTASSSSMVRIEFRIGWDVGGREGGERLVSDVALEIAQIGCVPKVVALYNTRVLLLEHGITD